MPGVASLVNNSVPNGASIQVYYNTTELNLGLVLQSGDPAVEDPQKSFAAKSTDHPGIIVNPSQVGAAEYLGINLVVGITQPVLKPGETDYTLYNVSIVSPVYRPLTTTEVTNTSITICASEKNAWVYYLGGTDSSSMELKEYRLDTFGVISHPNTTKILKGSSLAAYYSPDEKKRFVVYQAASDNSFYEYCVEDDEPLHIKNSTDAQKGTTIAVTYVDKKAYLYYTDGSYDIRKIVKTNGKWGSSSGLDSSDPLDPSSQLTVSTSNATNHLFYIQDGETAGNLSHVRDPIDS